jgi:hypothetical protein
MAIHLVLGFRRQHSGGIPEDHYNNGDKYGAPNDNRSIYEGCKSVFDIRLDRNRDIPRPKDEYDDCHHDVDGNSGANDASRGLGILHGLGASGLVGANAGVGHLQAAERKERPAHVGREGVAPQQRPDHPQQRHRQP